MKNTAIMIVCIITLVVFFCLPCHAQNYSSDEGKWSEKYRSMEFTVYDIIELAKEVKWKPKNNGIFKGSFELFEKSLLQICHENPNVIRSMHMDGLYYCSKNHDILFQRYNSIYPMITKNTWDSYCPILYTLISVDETGSR